ncbi:MAG: hypothetical protein ACRCV9_17960 [Burkholderiaceae bacterium]
MFETAKVVTVNPAPPTGSSVAVQGNGGVTVTPPSSLLGQGGATDAAAAAASDPFAWLHAQHRVMTAEGKLDEAASVRKQAENYAPLAQRMKEVGAPPKSADEYAFEVPEAMKAVFDPAKDENFGAFRSKAFELGMTQKQFQVMAEEYVTRMPQIADAIFGQSVEQGEKALRETWKSDEQFKAGLKTAAAAVRAFDPQAFGEGGAIDESSPLRALMNNAYFLKFAAHFGKQLQEDTSPGVEASLPAGSPYRGMTLQQLESNEAYLNPRHADHQIISAMVQQAYHKQTGEDLPGR